MKILSIPTIMFTAATLTTQVFCSTILSAQNVPVSQKNVDVHSIVSGSNGLVTPEVKFLSAPPPGLDIRQLGFSEDMRVTSITIEDKLAYIGVSASQSGQKRYALAMAGRPTEIKQGPAEGWRRDYTAFFVPTTDPKTSLPLYLRATGTPPVAIRYFVPSYFEGEWAPEDGSPVKVAVYQQWAREGVDLETPAKLLIDLDGDTAYHFKASSPEVRALDEPFKIRGQGYQAHFANESKSLVFNKCNSDGPEITILQTGETAPDWVCQDFSGKNVRLSDFRGKYVFFDVWATWCSPCTNELPHIQRLQEKYGDKVAIVGVNIDESMAEAKKWVNDTKLTYTHLWADGEWKSEICQQYHISSIPATFLVDPEGRLISIGLRQQVLEHSIAMAANPESPQAKQFMKESIERSGLLRKVNIMGLSGEKAKAIEVLEALKSKHKDPVGIAEIQSHLDRFQKP